MKKEQTTETQNIMEYLAQIYFEKGSIAIKELYPMALYLYQHASMGPKGTKKAAQYLVRLDEMTKGMPIESLKDAHLIEGVKEVENRLTTCFHHKPVEQFVLEKAQQTLQLAQEIMASRSFVYEAYDEMFHKSYTKLQNFCIQKEYACIYYETKILSSILLKNEEKKEEIKRNVKSLKARLNALIRTSRKPKYILSLADCITQLDYALEELQYQKMKEEMMYAKAILAQLGNVEGIEYPKQNIKQ